VATVIKLKEAMNTGSQGMRSLLEDPADRTAINKKTRPAATVYAPNLITVSTTVRPTVRVPEPTNLMKGSI
jgi:hypothetical protein